MAGSLGGVLTSHLPSSDGSTRSLTLRFFFQVLAIATVASACGDGPRRTPGELRGVMLPTPQPKVDFTLSTTAGEPFSFGAETDGYVTLLFFGYSHCPDICPVHMANIAAVLDKLPPAVASQIKVVMVTTDPERDTPARLRSWLDNFSPSFIGLSGPLDRVNEIQRTLGVPPAVHAPGEGTGYTVGHASQVMAFTRDDRAHVVYPFGTRQADWAHDLPLLVAPGWERR